MDDFGSIAYITWEQFEEFGTARKSDGTNAIDAEGRGCHRYSEYLAWEQEREEIEDYLQEEKKWYFLHNILVRFTRKSSKRSRTRRQSRPQILPPPPVGTIKYIPGLLPTPEEYIQMGAPKIIYQPEQRKLIWTEAIANGWNYSTMVFDSSDTGCGKSHTAGLLKPNDFHANTIWHLAQNHRNPTVATLEENSVDLPARSNGLVTDDTRKTALGKPFVRHPRGDEKLDTHNNCCRAHFFNVLAEKNRDIHDITAKDNPLCRTCPKNRKNCASHRSNNNGVGFLADRIDAAEHDIIRAR